MIRPGCPLALVLAAAGLLAGCSSGTATPAAPRSGPSAATTGPVGATPPTPLLSDGAVVREITLVVSGSQVSGDTGLVELAVGQPARVTVTSDVADEVHVHGPGDGFSADVEKGGTVRIDVVETVPGRFEIELEGAKRVLTRLQVR